jgi:phage terminase large subunit-like protein
VNEPAPSLGKWVCAWIEKTLVHAEGDYFGKDFKLLPWQKRFIWKAYELERNGGRRYRRALLGLAKGAGKTELAAALALAELAGPVVFDGWESPGVPKHPVPRQSPDIPVVALSHEQADLVFGAARNMVTESRLAPGYEAFDTEIQPKEGPGRLYRVHSASGSNDGRRPTFYVCDELHEFLGTKEKVHRVLANGTAKRRDAWWLAITTAGFDTSSLLGRLYAHGRRVEAGEEEDRGFLFEWHAAPDDVDLEDEEQVRAGIMAANPATGAGGFASLDNALRKLREIPEHEFRRYFLNQWAEAPDTWIPADSWHAAADPARVVDKGVPVVLGFDGSYNRDSTALLGCTLEEVPHLFMLGLWERPEGAGEWSVDKGEILGAIEDAVVRYEVRNIAVDDTFGRIWSMDLEALREKGVLVVDWPTRSRPRMGPACAEFYAAVQDGRMTHDGSSDLARHLANCVTKGTPKGLVITKEHPTSTRHIDAAVAAVIALDMAIRGMAKRRTPWLIATAQIGDRDY